MEIRLAAPRRRDVVRRSTGFTLVEMMVTVFIAAILMAIGIPAMRDAAANNRLTGQTNEMVAAITMARSEAITKNQLVTFCRSATDAATTCAGTVANWQFWLVRTASGTVIRRGTLPDGLTVTSALAGDQVVFASDGLGRTNNELVSGGPHITVCAAHPSTGNRRQVTLGAGSRISTEKASGACS
jgi:type IV fimbrial biogenesis protein FimT